MHVNYGQVPDREIPEPRINLPVPFPSCPAFGGRILAITGLGVTGLAEGWYAPHNHIRE